MINTLISIDKYKEGDFETYFDLVKEDNVMRYVSGKGLTEDQANDKFSSMIKINQEQNQMGYFKIYNESGVFIGDGKLEWDKKGSSQLEVGYILKEAFWGKGYGTKICSKLLGLADELWPNTNVIGIIDPANAASKKLLEKFGFQSYFLGVEDDLPTQKLILRKKLAPLTSNIGIN